MPALHVVRWKRYGHDRLYVNLPDGSKVAWLDQRTGELTLLVEGYRDAVLTALRPHLAASATQESPPPPVPPPGPETDLALNRPGEALRAKLAETRTGFWLSLLNLLLRRRSESYSWRRGLAGEQAVGAELERLTRHGWRVLHSIPLPREVDIDHLLIGPGGVFTFNAKHHRGARIWVGDDSVRIGRDTYPYVRKARAEARRASAALTRACGFPVAASPVLAFVDAARLTVVPTLHDVRVVSHREVAALRSLGETLSPDHVERIYTTARRRTTWTTA